MRTFWKSKALPRARPAVAEAKVPSRLPCRRAHRLPWAWPHRLAAWGMGPGPPCGGGWWPRFSTASASPPLACWRRATRVPSLRRSLRATAGRAVQWWLALWPCWRPRQRGWSLARTCKWWQLACAASLRRPSCWNSSPTPQLLLQTLLRGAAAATPGGAGTTPACTPRSQAAAPAGPSRGEIAPSWPTAWSAACATWSTSGGRSRSPA